MAQKFKEVAHLRTDLNKYGEGYDRIFRKKEVTEAKQMIDEMVEKDREEMMKIKELARECYDELIIDIIGYEQNPDPWSYMIGFIDGHKKGRLNNS
jgi:hypothetical protein